VSALVAFVFRDQFRAPEVLNELRRRDWLWVRDLDYAVAVTLNECGKARAHLSVDLPMNEGAGWARFWGSFLNTTLFIPSADVMVEAVEGFAFYPRVGLAQGQESNGRSRESDWWVKTFEAARNFKRDVAALIAPNGSAIFMLLRTPNTSAALKQLGNYGDTIVHTSLSIEQDEKLLAILATSKHMHL
jgi:uncharacterized membrane protein